MSISEDWVMGILYLSTKIKLNRCTNNGDLSLDREKSGNTNTQIQTQTHKLKLIPSTLPVEDMGSNNHNWIGYCLSLTYTAYASVTMGSILMKLGGSFRNEIKLIELQFHKNRFYQKYIATDEVLAKGQNFWGISKISIWMKRKYSYLYNIYRYIDT